MKTTVIILFASVAAVAAGAATPREEVLADLRRVAVSDRFYYATRQPQRDISAGRNVIAEKGGVMTKVWLTDLACISGTWHKPAWYAENRTNITAMVKRRWGEHRALTVFTWHMANPYTPPRWRYEKNHSSDAFRFKPGVKGFPAEHTRLLSEILGGTGGECGTGTIDGKPYYPAAANPREWYFRILEQQAEFLNGLVDSSGRRIPVVVRYLHESDGGWFPWGHPYATAEEFKEVCRQTCRHLRGRVGTDSLLFAYTPDRFWTSFGHEGDTNNTFLARYPGDEYVDIVGIDDYSIGTGETDRKTQYRFKNTVRQLRELSEFAAVRGKVAVISETGIGKATRPDFHSWLLKVCTAEGVRVAFAATWGGPYSVPSSEAGLADWRRFLADPHVLAVRLPR